jgi:PAS domain
MPEDDQSMDSAMQPFNEQLTIRIDTDRNILKISISKTRSLQATFLTKEVGNKIDQLVHPADRQKLLSHLNEVVQQDMDALMTSYRLKTGPDTYAYTKVQSRMFRSAIPDEPDYIMVMHEIIDTEGLGIDGDGNYDTFSNQHQQNMLLRHGSQVGDPVLAGGSNFPMNGVYLPQSVSRGNAYTNEDSLAQGNPFGESLFPPEFGLDFTSPSLDLDNQFESRPASRTSMASVSTPRPSSTNAMCASPLTPYSQPSPASITNNNNTSMTNNNLTNSNLACGSNNNSSGFNSAGSNNSASFQFPFDDKEQLQKMHHHQQQQQQQQQQQHQQQQQQQQENATNSTNRLRTLLMKSPSALEDERGNNQILKVHSRPLDFFC